MEIISDLNTVMKVEKSDPDVTNDTSEQNEEIKHEIEIDEMKLEHEDKKHLSHIDDKLGNLHAIMHIKVEPCIEDSNIEGIEALNELQIEPEVQLEESSNKTENIPNIRKPGTRLKRYTCHICFRRFSRQNNYEMHIEIHAGIRKQREYICHICLKQFTQNSNLIRHIRIHTGEKPFVCEICAKSFSEKIHLKRHLLIHKDKEDVGDKITLQSIKKITNFHLSGLKLYNKKRQKQNEDKIKYECEHCSKTFNSLSTKQSHARIHDANFIPHECLVCEKKFLNKDDLRVHLRSHTGEKPYTCDICSKNFSRSTNLSRHRNVHFRSYEYPCEICPKICKHESNLVKHMKIHTRDQCTFTCEICSKTFTLLKSFRNHQRRHKAKALFTCSLCSKAFDSLESLNVHINTHANDK